MRFLVFQHIDIEHPGIFREFFAADGIAWDAVELDAGEKIPALDVYDALWVMGGPMDVWEVDQHPWLEPEMAAIREAVAVKRMPFLGLCLGHQLLGASLGGKVGKAAQAEVGILDVELTAEGRRDPLFDGLRDRFKALQWHGAEVAALPAGAVVLAQSQLCKVQAMRIGSHAYGLQYHTELTPETVPQWGAVPTYACSLDQTLGQGALERLKAEAAANMADFNGDSRQLYENFMRLSGLRRRLVA
ncbi:MAG TPA: type 1 glutamine amidotransferase [Verrucomicrobiae bacterium]|jgi:GMP synthase-like glutamine amidotransferase|nr:type 1 glutamine amidotransferase [Verrucomicrobiae bacterium]